MTWKRELLDVCRDLRKQCRQGGATKQIEGTPFTISITFQGMRAVARGRYMQPFYTYSLFSKGQPHVETSSQDAFVEVASRYLSRDQEKESQSSKHCDAGYMNDVRFGVEP